MEITKEKILELFTYKDCSLYRNKNNKKAGTINGDGYIHIGIDNKYYKEHRLIYFLFNGYFPDVIDHKDGNKQNNSIDNLRSCTKSENSLNAKGKNYSKSRYKGISYDKRYDTYVAAITINRKRKYIGSYKEPIRAAFAYNQYAEVYHKEFARLNIL